jgi:hypothetical protein
VKKPVAKSKAKATPLKMESAGDILCGNIWFKIGLTKAEAPMLKTIGRRLCVGSVTSAQVLRTLLLVALAHYDKLEPMIFQDAAYSYDEGFLMMPEYLHGVITSQHAKIEEPKWKVKK